MANHITNFRPQVWTIVVAAGSGSRFGGPKQFSLLGDRSVLDWSLAAAAAASSGVVVVLSGDQLADFDLAASSADGMVEGGETRAESVRAGLRLVPEAADIVCVHDAARPFAAPSLFAEVVAAVVGGADGAIPGVPIVDTVKLLVADSSSADECAEVDHTLDRSRLVAVQTPQAFRATMLRAAHASGAEGTDDASLVERFGGTVVSVAGDPANRKVTFLEDLHAMNSQLNSPESAMRIGHAYDVHPFSQDPNRPLILGGVRFADVRGLAGHSDADCVTHAVIDAVLAATGNGDIGQWFPDTDEDLAGADSVELLRQVMDHVLQTGWTVQNVDCTVVAEAPKLAPRRAEMQQLLSAIVRGPVTVKGKRAEGLGSLGRGEGVACWAVALVTHSPNLAE
jgi:2-C-methyl-D-erythritol 4-phosphate cytidylyltransferase / 2-C-methyl-D-erythritol 2,4-cyclodiphosphate synthase